MEATIVALRCNFFSLSHLYIALTRIVLTRDRTIQISDDSDKTRNYMLTKIFYDHRKYNNIKKKPLVPAGIELILLFTLPLIQSHIFLHESIIITFLCTFHLYRKKHIEMRSISHFSILNIFFFINWIEYIFA